MEDTHIYIYMAVLLDRKISAYSFFFEDTFVKQL